MNCHTIRAWERRYSAIEPFRNRENNRRQYSAIHIDRLLLLGRLVKEGHQISLLATLSNESLAKMCHNKKLATNISAEISLTEKKSTKSIKKTLSQQCLAALKNFEIGQLMAKIELGRLSLSPTEFVLEFAMPLMRAVQENTKTGILCAAKNSSFCSTLRTQLLQSLYSLQSATQKIARKNRATNLSICLAGTSLAQAQPNNHDDFLILSAAILTAGHEHRTHYLGTNLSATAVASAACSLKTQVVLIGSSLDSGCLEPLQQAAYVNELNANLPTNCEIWWCGAEELSDGAHFPNVSTFSSLERLTRHLASKG
jgi:DNA-binding transcriptional MerR regulator